MIVRTLEAAFLGKKELFKDLYLYENYDFKTIYPVIRFDFGNGSETLNYESTFKVIKNTIVKCINQYQLNITTEFDESDIQSLFKNLLEELYIKTKTQVVVLVDEYDKPILDVMDNEIEIYRARELVKKLYATLKISDDYLHFVFLTGITKFSKASIFSGLNNLKDISLHPKYADICGITEDELDIYFNDRFSDNNVDRLELKRWYNGYNFMGTQLQKVYNPHSIMNFCEYNYQYNNYWIDSGLPHYVAKLLYKNAYNIIDLEHLDASLDTLKTFDIPNFNLITLLYQSGHLTIDSYEIESGNYVLTYPNKEIEMSLNVYLFKEYMGQYADTYVQALALSFLHNNKVKIEECITAVFASLPNRIYSNSPLDRYGAYYQMMLYQILKTSRFKVISEDVTSRGYIDISVETSKYVYILELKVSHDDKDLSINAINQINEKHYVDKFLALNKPIYKIGMSFSSETRNLNGFECIEHKETLYNFVYS